MPHQKIVQGMSTVAADDLQPGWEAHTSPEGDTYYYNASTGESVWDKPTIATTTTTSLGVRMDEQSVRKRLRLNSTNEDDKNRLLEKFHNLDSIQDPQFAQYVHEWISLGYPSTEAAVAIVQNFEAFAEQINTLGTWLDLISPGTSITLAMQQIQNAFLGSVPVGGEALEQELDSMLLAFENLPLWLDSLLQNDMWLPFFLDLYARVPKSRFVYFCLAKLVSKLGYIDAIAEHAQLCHEFFSVFAEAMKRAIVANATHANESPLAKLKRLASSSPAAYKLILAVLTELQSSFADKEHADNALYWIFENMLKQVQGDKPSVAAEQLPAELGELIADMLKDKQFHVHCLQLVQHYTPEQYSGALRSNDFLQPLFKSLFSGPPNIATQSVWTPQTKDAAFEVLLHVVSTSSTSSTLNKKSLAQVSNLSLEHFQLIAQDMPRVFDPHSNRKFIIQVQEKKSFLLGPDLNHPTMASAMLWYLDGMVQQPKFQQKDLVESACKMALAMGEIHALLRELVVEFLIRVFAVLNAHQYSKQLDKLQGGVIIQICELVVVQGMVKMLVLGRGAQVLDFMQQHLHQLDFSILRKFFLALFALTQPPYSTGFKQRITALFQCNEVQNLDIGGGEEFVQAKRYFLGRLDNN